MICPMKFSSDSASCSMFVVTDKCHSFCSAVRIRRTNFAATRRMFKSCVGIAWQVPKDTPTSTESSRIAKRQFAPISSHTCATQSSVLLVVGLPDCGLSSSESRPSLNLLCHSKMWARLKHCSPKAVLNISNVCTQFLPSFTQNLMHTRCSCSSNIPHSTNNNKVQVHDSLRPKLTKDWGVCWDHPLSQEEREF